MSRDIRQLTLAETRRGYDAWSESYDDDANPMVAASDWVLARTPLACAEADVLELGCGTGRHATRVLAAGARSYAGIDASRGMLARARERVPDARASWIEGDVSAPPVAAGAFDLALVVLVLEHLPSLDAAFGALARALRPGGRLRLIEIHPDLVASGTVAHFRAGSAEIRFASTAHPVASMRTALAAAALAVIDLTEHRASGALLAAIPRLGKHRDKLVMLDVTAVRQPDTPARGGARAPGGTWHRPGT